MATERMEISLPPSKNNERYAELEKLLNDGWQVKRWRHDVIDKLTYFMLEREVPDHGSA